MLCPHCNTNVPDGSSFCENCGAALAAAASAAAPATQPEAPAAQLAVPAAQPEAQAGAQPTDGQYQPPAYDQASVQQEQFQQQTYQQQYQSEQQYQQPNYQQPQYQQANYQQNASGQVGSKNKLAAGLLGIFLGSLGIHKFYLGYTQAGVIMLVVTLVGGLLTLGFAAAVMSIIGIVEGIMYLVKTDYDFYQTYEVGRKQWF